MERFLWGKGDFNRYAIPPFVFLRVCNSTPSVLVYDPAPRLVEQDLLEVTALFQPTTHPGCQ